MVQDGFYADASDTDPTKKDRDYNAFKSIVARWRKRPWGGWKPDTLADETRRSFEHPDGYRNAQEWAIEMARDGRRPPLDHWYHQETYVEVWFEADAMRAQFEHYTRGMTLRPFKGDASVDYKWQIAKSLEKNGEKYGLPIVALYFGDKDKKGDSIPRCALAGIRKWCNADFDFVRVGLNAGDGERLGIPENPDKPGQYQWEALTDEAARVMITGAVERYVNMDILADLERESLEAGRMFGEYVRGFTL
jgi:hypothetical protein